MKEIALVFITAAVIAAVLKWWPLSPRARLRREERQWAEGCRARGLSAGEQRDEWLFRHAVARLRIATSRAVMLEPERANEIIRDAITDEAAILLDYDASLSKRFASTMRAADIDEILLPPAVDAMIGACTARAPELTDDEVSVRLAALR